ncbi:MAG: nucleotide sugar dehydrogenase [Pseudomonadota bacterium]
MSDILRDKICMVGLGYVGLPLAVAFAEKFDVVGYDIDQSRVAELKTGHDSTREVDDGMLADVRSNMLFVSNIQECRECNVYIVTVPTPIDKSNRPDLTPLIASSRSIGNVLNQGDIVIYESTVYPGVTEDVCIPELENISGLKYNKEFFVGYSPERINPGDKERTVKKIVKVTSGSTSEIAKRVDGLYQTVITAGTHLASSIKVAEASKVIENTQRDVNIALINELALIFDQMDIDTREVLAAAATKWNFINLQPGLVGGHCIGVDPYYLTFKAEELGYKPDLILASRQINNGMGKYIAEKTIKKMIHMGKRIKSSSVLMLGVTFKEDCPDMRNSKVIDIINELNDYGADVEVYDPWFNIEENEKYSHLNVVSDPITAGKQYDAVVVAVAHKQFKTMTMNDYRALSKGEMVVIDVKGIVAEPSWRL